MRKRGVVILMAAALTASVPATALADQFAGQIALNGEAALEGIADEESQVDMDQTEEADDEKHEESEDAGLKETDEAEVGTEESDPEESEPEESEEEVKESEKSDESGKSENEDADTAELESKEDELEDELQKEPSKASEEESGDMPEIGTEEFTTWFKKNCKEDFLWKMLAEHVENDTFFTWAVEHDKLYYKAFKSYQKLLEKDGQPDEEMSYEVEAETGENMAVLDEEVEELT